MNWPGYQAGMTGAAKKWFEKNRDLHVREVLDDFLRINHYFQYIFLLDRDCRKEQGAVRFAPENEAGRRFFAEVGNRLGLMVGSELDKGPLWRLKDDCHLMWRDSAEEHGMLVDWFIGSIFHEAMKLKENIYLLNKYGPTALSMQERSTVSGHRSSLVRASGPDLDTLLNVRELMERVADDVAGQLRQIGSLLEKTAYVIREMMPELVRNELVLRLLVEREDLVCGLWGGTLDDFFRLFFAEASEGFCAAGSSYLKGQWYPQALNMYRRALRANRNCDEAIVRVAQLEAIVRENRDILGLG